MRCVKCSGQFITFKGNLKLSDKILGDFIVPDTEWDQCDRCNEILYTPVTMRAIEKFEAVRKKDLLLSKQIRDFIPATEVAKILDCSRQAIHKHKRIRRGFIHFIMYNKSYLYLKESVELYKETGDGRLPLAKQETQILSNMVDFSKYYAKRQIAQKTECVIDAGSDSSCVIDSQKNKENIIEELLEG